MSRKVRLAGSGKKKCFRELRKHAAGSKRSRATGRKFKGLTKHLEKYYFSPNGNAPKSVEIVPRRGLRGRARGTHVDAQLSKIANGGIVQRKHKLTKAVLEALHVLGIRPVAAQVALHSEKRGVATACDLICLPLDGNSAAPRLILVELKCGFAGVRERPFTRRSIACTMQGVFHNAVDTHLHRHLLQLACTTAMLQKETAVLKSMSLKSINIESLLIYACESGVEIIELPSWWLRRANEIM